MVEDETSRFPQNVDTYPPDYTALTPDGHNIKKIHSNIVICIKDIVIPEI
jgi:hypothetical protein